MSGEPFKTWRTLHIDSFIGYFKTRHDINKRIKQRLDEKADEKKKILIELWQKDIESYKKKHYHDTKAELNSIEMFSKETKEAVGKAIEVIFSAMKENFTKEAIEKAINTMVFKDNISSGGEKDDNNN